MTDAATWTRALTLVGIIFVAYLMTMWIVMVVWTHRDIASRTASRTQRLSAVATVGLFNAPGFLLYLVLRPSETSSELLLRQLEADALVQDMERQPACPGCGHGVAAEFLVCPYCRTAVQTPCGACTRSLRMSWVLCPYCGTERPEMPNFGPTQAPAPAERVPAFGRETPQPAGQRVLAPTAKA